MGMTIRRPERVADIIRLELARVLREEVRDPRVGFVTLTDVQLSPDLRSARVFVSTLEQDEQTTLDALEHATPFIRRALARSADLRFTPRLQFVFDRSLATGSRVETLLQEIRPQDEPEPEEGQHEGDDPVPPETE
jgi:ribosome-binding factor A